ncbi:MAG: DUF1588 domain-containing protein [Pirellula sp.]
MQFNPSQVIVIVPNSVAVGQRPRETATFFRTQIASKWWCMVAVLCAGNSHLLAQESSQSFETRVRPFLAKYCNDCHSGESPEAKLDTTIFRSPSDVASSWSTWQAMVSRVHESEMPPPDVAQPTALEKQQLEQWTSFFRKSEAERLRGDPGLISTRRLNNAEYNYTIRDLTGVDIRPTKSFPIDPANESGFDNSAESLTISPALVSKYIDAARLVADNMLLTPDGIRFAPFPVVTDTDRDKYCVQRIVDFYLRQPVSYEAYLFACWTVQTELEDQSRSELQGDIARKKELLASAASQFGLSEKYLSILWQTLHDPSVKVGPMAKLRENWKQLPTDPADIEISRQQCSEIAKFIRDTRSKLRWRASNVRSPGMHGGTQSFILWKNREMASHRRLYPEEDLALDGEDALAPSEDRVRLKTGTNEEREEVLSSYRTFCSVFPDNFFILERGRANVDPKESDREGKGRLLSAGFHSMMGYFRDDQPLCELILSDEKKQELDRLWGELDFIALAPSRQFSGFIWFERAEASFINDEQFQFIRAEDRSATSEPVLQRFKELYLDKVRSRKANAQAIEAVEYHFDDMNRQIRALEARLEESKPIQLESLLEFAQSAYRRPMTRSERDSLVEFYKRCLSLPNADHRSAMEDTLVSILVSPTFLYRWDLQCSSEEVTDLKGVELASRWSYFLWASKPDGPLQSAIASLHGDPVIPDSKATLQKMLADDRARGMVLEFMGNWLDFRRFDNHNGVDREQFPTFSDTLRQSMADEPVEYFLDLLRRNGSILELLQSDHMIMNGPLSQHYGIGAIPAEATNRWERVEEASKIGRGGLLSMAVFLTQNSPGQRTSPVKRGYWVVRKLLGEVIPPPPPNVPELPASEHQLGDLTLRELLAKHREHASCAACHNRFDSIGLLLEGFDPIGKPRTKDLGGRDVFVDAVLPNGRQASGLVGLRAFILEERLDDFRRHFCKSLLSYALGRSLIIPDDLLVEEMLDNLRRNDDKIQSVFETIVASPQFRTKRSGTTALSAASLSKTP